jgi:hypothetical protein
MIVPLGILNELSWGLLKLADSVSCIARTIFNALDFGTSVAKWLDSMDPNPNNGWVDVKW